MFNGKMHISKNLQESFMGNDFLSWEKFLFPLVFSSCIFLLVICIINFHQFDLIFLFPLCSRREFVEMYCKASEFEAWLFFYSWIRRYCSSKICFQDCWGDHILLIGNSNFLQLHYASLCQSNNYMLSVLCHFLGDSLSAIHHFWLFYFIQHTL